MMKMATYTRQKNWERVKMPESINMKILRKAVLLNNNIFQAQNKSYIEKVLYNTQDEFIYFYPVSSETILKMDARFAIPCMIVYTAFTTQKNISKNDMIRMNYVYKIIKAAIC